MPKFPKFLKINYTIGKQNTNPRKKKSFNDDRFNQKYYEKTSIFRSNYTNNKIEIHKIFHDDANLTQERLAHGAWKIGYKDCFC